MDILDSEQKAKAEAKTRQLLSDYSGQKIEKPIKPETLNPKQKEIGKLPPEKYRFHDRNFDNTEGVHLMEGNKKVGAFKDMISSWNYNGKSIPVPARWHPHSVIKRLIQHNKLGQYTGIVMIGQSGSGKTTLTRKIIHQIHSMGENYVVKWFNGHEMLHMDEHIKNMQVGTPHIMIFDDASYTLEDAKKSEVAKLANALTTIRHTLKSRIIMIMNIHYSKATAKFFRNQHFTFLTSVSVEEMGNYTDLFKDKMHVIRAFSKSYNKMMLRGYFDAPVSSFEKTTIQYHTNKPFRVCLVAEIADLHFMLYNKDECSFCDPRNQAAIWQSKKQPKTVDTIMEKFSEMYCGGKGEKLPAAFSTTLRFFTKIAQSKDSLTLHEKQMWNHFTNIGKAGFDDWDQLLERVNSTRKRKHDKSRHNKVKANATVLEIARMVKKEQEEEQAEKPMETPDYDSSYVPVGDGSDGRS